MKIILFILLLTHSFTTFSQQQCANTIYVSPLYAAPNAIHTALNNVGAGGTVRLMTGTFYINWEINIPSDVTLEGGFYVAGNDTLKTSEYGATTIHRESGNHIYFPAWSATSPINYTHYIAIKADNKSNFRIQDLKVTTFDGFSGSSKYGIYLNGCNDYSIVRCGIEPGAGGNGLVLLNEADTGLDGGNGDAGGNPGVVASGFNGEDGELQLASEAASRGWGGDGGVAAGMPPVWPFAERGNGAATWEEGGRFGQSATSPAVGGNGGGGGHGGGPYCGNLTLVEIPGLDPYWVCTGGVTYYGGMPGGNGGVTVNNSTPVTAGSATSVHQWFEDVNYICTGLSSQNGANGSSGADGLPGIDGSVHQYAAFFQVGSKGGTGIR